MTFRVDSLFRWSVLTISYTGPLYTKFKDVFSKWTISNYIIKSPAVNIQSLTDIITKDLIIRQRIQDVRFKAPTIL